MIDLSVGGVAFFDRSIHRSIGLGQIFQSVSKNNLAYEVQSEFPTVPVVPASSLCPIPVSRLDRLVTFLARCQLSVDAMLVTMVIVRLIMRPVAETRRRQSLLGSHPLENGLGFQVAGTEPNALTCQFAYKH